MKAKRSVFGLVVVILAISFSAFTTHVEKTENAKFGTYYWFQLDGSGVPITASRLLYSSSDPSGCSFLGLGGYCMAAFTSYTQDVYGYHAAGFEVVAHYYPF